MRPLSSCLVSSGGQPFAPDARKAEVAAAVEAGTVKVAGVPLLRAMADVARSAAILEALRGAHYHPPEVTRGNLRFWMMRDATGWSLRLALFLGVFRVTVERGAWSLENSAVGDKAIHLPQLLVAGRFVGAQPPVGLLEAAKPVGQGPPVGLLEAAEPAFPPAVGQEPTGKAAASWEPLGPSAAEDDQAAEGSFIAQTVATSGDARAAAEPSEVSGPPEVSGAVEPAKVSGAAQVEPAEVSGAAESAPGAAQSDQAASDFIKFIHAVGILEPSWLTL
jgi:hypothetical protein